MKESNLIRMDIKPINITIYNIHKHKSTIPVIKSTKIPKEIGMEIPDPANESSNCPQSQKK